MKNLTNSKNLIKDPRPLPTNFKQTWDGIVKMRQEGPLAPVDTMGSSKLHNSESTQNEQAYQTLINLILSAQSRDEVTAKVMNILMYEKSMTINKIYETEEEEIVEWLSNMNFRNKKAKYIKQTTKHIVEKHNKIVPNTQEDLIKFPGVGYKMANLLLQEHFGITAGISVDTHVHRISNRLKWVKTQNPDKTRTDLENWLPTDKWKEINELLVGFGQTICKPLNPLCQKCEIRKFCPYGSKKKKIVDIEDVGKELESNHNINLITKQKNKKRTISQIKSKRLEHSNNKKK